MSVSLHTPHVNSALPSEARPGPASEDYMPPGGEQLNVALLTEH